MDDLAVALVRSAPLGYFRLARAFRAARPSLRRYSAETRYGRLTCDIGEPGCFPLIKFGHYPHWERDEKAIDGLALGGESVIVDVGANIGAMCKIFARRAKVVHAFEPSPRALECFPYSSPFQAGQAVTLTSSCNATSTWLAASTNAPPPVTRGERGR